MSNQLAYLFPAFVLKYTGKELALLQKYNYDFQSRLNIAEKCLNIPLGDFDISHNNFTDHEFKNQILSYIFSCSFSDLLKKEKPAPDYISGFSMGIYAALYHTESLEFTDGLKLITSVYKTIKGILKDQEFTMASAIGFSKADLLNYLKKYPSTELAIENGIYSFVIAGSKDELFSLIHLLQNEGAIHTSIFNVAFPYHSKLLLKHQETFNELISGFSVYDPSLTYFSMINQKALSKKQQLYNELANNITHPLSFLKTITELKHMGINNFIEIGADTSLLKSSKFIEGDFNFSSVAKGKMI